MLKVEVWNTTTVPTGPYIKQFMNMLYTEEYPKYICILLCNENNGNLDYFCFRQILLCTENY